MHPGLKSRSKLIKCMPSGVHLNLLQCFVPNSAHQSRWKGRGPQQWAHQSSWPGCQLWPAVGSPAAAQAAARAAAAAAAAAGSCTAAAGPEAAAAAEEAAAAAAAAARKHKRALQRADSDDNAAISGAILAAFCKKRTNEVDRQSN